MSIQGLNSFFPHYLPYFLSANKYDLASLIKPKKQRNHFANKGPSSQGYGLSSSHVGFWELDYTEGRGQRVDAFELEKTLESPLDSKVIKPVNLKEINVEYTLEGLMLKLKLQYFG